VSQHKNSRNERHTPAEGRDDGVYVQRKFVEAEEVQRRFGKWNVQHYDPVRRKHNCPDGDEDQPDNLPHETVL